MSEVITNIQSFFRTDPDFATFIFGFIGTAITAISTAIVFLVKRKRLAIKNSLSENTSQEKKLESVITTTARLKTVSNSTQVCVQVTNLSDNPKNFSIEAKIISAEDEQNPFIRAITLPDSKTNLQMLGKAIETLDVAKLISSRRGPGKAICVVEIKSHNSDESFSRSLPLN